MDQRRRLRSAGRCRIRPPRRGASLACRLGRNVRREWRGGWAPLKGVLCFRGSYVPCRRTPHATRGQASLGGGVHARPHRPQGGGRVGAPSRSFRFSPCASASTGRCGACFSQPVSCGPMRANLSNLGDPADLMRLVCRAGPQHIPKGCLSGRAGAARQAGELQAAEVRASEHRRQLRHQWERVWGSEMGCPYAVRKGASPRGLNSCCSSEIARPGPNQGHLLLEPALAPLCNLVAPRSDQTCVTGEHAHQPFLISTL